MWAGVFDLVRRLDVCYTYTHTVHKHAGTYAYTCNSYHIRPPAKKGEWNLPMGGAVDPPYGHFVLTTFVLDIPESRFRTKNISIVWKISRDHLLS